MSEGKRVGCGVEWSVQGAREMGEPETQMRVVRTSKETVAREDLRNRLKDACGR